MKKSSPSETPQSINMRQINSNRTKLLIALIPAVLAVMMPLLWLSNYNAANLVDWDQTKKVLEVIQSAATIAALIAGASWTYFNFFKGRTYRARLEPKISGQFITKNGANYLVITAQLKNVGLSQVPIDQKGSAIRLLAYTPEVEFFKVHSVAQSRLVTVGAFEAHGWIEPGETIEDQRLIALPKNGFVALQIQLRLVSNQMEWNTAAIAQNPLLTNGKTSPANLDLGEDSRSILETTGVKELGAAGQSIEKMTASTPNLGKTVMKDGENTEKTDRIEREKESATEIQVKQLSNEKKQIESSPPNLEKPETKTPE